MCYVTIAGIWSVWICVRYGQHITFPPKGALSNYASSFPPRPHDINKSKIRPCSLACLTLLFCSIKVCIITRATAVKTQRQNIWDMRQVNTKRRKTKQNALQQLAVNVPVAACVVVSVSGVPGRISFMFFFHLPVCFAPVVQLPVDSPAFSAAD